jgi:hypothetical protein
MLLWGAYLRRKERRETKPSSGSGLALELWINGAKVDASGFRLRTSQAEPVLRGKLPGGASVAVRIEGGKLTQPRYTLEVDERPLPLAIHRGRSR